MKFDKAEFDRRRKKAPRGTYLIMTLMGAYMFYIVSRIVQGLAEPDVSGRLLIYAALVLIAACGIFFVAFGLRALVKGEYAEAQAEEEAENIEEDTSAQEPEALQDKTESRKTDNQEIE